MSAANRGRKKGGSAGRQEDEVEIRLPSLFVSDTEVSKGFNPETDIRFVIVISKQGDIILRANEIEAGDDPKLLLDAMNNVAVLLASHAVDLVAKRIDGIYMDMSERLSTVEGKQSFTRQVNSLCRNHRLYIIHPDTRNPCYVFAVPDSSGGKLLLEDRVTKKRSHTTRDAGTMLRYLKRLGIELASSPPLS